MACLFRLTRIVPKSDPAVVILIPFFPAGFFAALAKSGLPGHAAAVASSGHSIEIG